MFAFAFGCPWTHAPGALRVHLGHEGFRLALVTFSRDTWWRDSTETLAAGIPMRWDGQRLGHFESHDCIFTTLGWLE